MNKYIKRSNWIVVVFLACLMNPMHAAAGEDDSYTYKLEVNNNDKVCSHMKEVYNRYFKRPFKASTNLADYGEGGDMRFPCCRV